ncbi:DUF5057 domain-containing protein [Paenibacillus wynnii]|uniref:DUF5057 domain-containing protein n=1 Tax=Paenibacillus wynnii TaxID=268407 RepID=UPI002793A830|nr:DUF5057 domain-containing protein [Paenibacillus wynnii]MDQ0192157.1 choice-of-anchor A domain-containing protein [Paenibacillus wynnii]
MKLIRRKQWILISGIALSILLIAASIQSFVLSVNATNNNYTIRILEITDPNSASLNLNNNFPLSELDGLQNLANIKIDTMTMKRFVSLRNNWDGKYDAIYIGKGDFSKTLINSTGSTSTAGREAAHKTISVENDITLLKAREITDYFINKGLYVFLRDETFTAQATSTAKQGILYSTFNPYRPNTKSNIVFLRDKEALDTFTDTIKKDTSPYLTGLTQRPRLTLTNKADIISYRDKPDHVYVSGDTLSFDVKLDNITDLTLRPVRVRLFMNVDSSLPMSENNVVATEMMKSSSGTIRYKLPKTYSGPLYWRMEISDTLSNLKDFDSGVIRYRGIKPVIKVLQVMPTDRTDSNLLSEDYRNMDTSYLSKADYELQITPMDMSEFNSYISSHTSATDTTSGLNGVYDMIVFGFQDMYDRVSTPMLSKAAADAVKAFAEETKQSLMLTHDTIFREVDANPSTPELDPYVESTTNGIQNLNYWSSYFHDMVGQALPRTYLGGSAVNPSTTVVPINDGLLTQYPFDLDNVALTSSTGRYKVATTHDQFFPLNLERADVIPWYNISGSSRDTDDSYNHFYTYSVGNITFSGTGHTNKNFPQWEQMLFVNTMYRAFTGANHAPEITVATPVDNSTKPSYQGKLVVSYTVNDWDIKDRNLITGIKFKVDDEYLSDYTMAEKTVQSGDTVTQTFNNPLPEGGALQIEIMARDSQGALATQKVNVTVEKVKSNLSISRSVSSDTVERGDTEHPLILTYTITPNPIPAYTIQSGEQTISQLNISNIEYSEKFPGQLEFLDPLPAGMSKSGSLETGYTLTRSFANIGYHLSEDGKTFEPDSAQPITFSLSVVPSKKQSYKLDEFSSKLKYVNVYDSSEIFSSINSLSSQFNAFIFGDVNLNSTSTKGRIAAAGNAEFTNYNLNGNGGPHDNALVAGGNFIFNGNNGASIRAKVTYGGTSTITPTHTKIDGTVTKGTPINFIDTQEFLLLESNTLASLEANGNVEKDLDFVGTDDNRNVFNITSSVLSNDLNNVLDHVKINAPRSSTVIINVHGENITINGGFNLTHIQSEHIILNFPEAKSLVLNDAINATILAPLANVQFDKGHLRGMLIAKTLRTDNDGRLELNPFTGTLPEVINHTKPVYAENTLYFNEAKFEAVVKVTALTLEEARININTELGMKSMVGVLPEDANNKNVSWLSLNPEVATVTDEGVVRGLQAGTAFIQITSTDGSNITATAPVEVISPDLNIIGPNKAYVGDLAEFKALYVTADEVIDGYEWSIKPGSNTAEAELSITSGNPLNDHATLKATKSGEVTLVARVNTEDSPDGAATKEHKVTFTNPVSQIAIDGEPLVKVGQKIPLQVRVIQPANADPAVYTWSLEGDGSTYAEIIPGTNTNSIELKGLKITSTDHPITVKVTTEGRIPGQRISATATITVGARLNGLSLRETIVIGVGSENSHSLFNVSDLSLFPDSMTLADIQGKLEWSSSNPAVVTVSPNGLITGLVKGSATVTASYKDNPTIRDTIQVTVINEDRY